MPSTCWRAMVPVLILMLTGCATPPTVTPPPRADLPRTSGPLPPPTRLMLADLQRAAGHGHPELRAARAAVLGAQGELRQAAAWANPELTIAADELIPHATGSREQRLELAQPLPAPGARRADRAAATAELAAREAEFHATARRVREEVALAYLEARFAQAEVACHDTLLGEAQAMLALAETRAAARAAPATERLAARQEVRELELARQRLAARLPVLARRLATLTGLPELTSDHLAGALPADPDLPASAALPHELPALAAARAEVARAQAGRQQAEAARWPTVTVSVEYGRQLGEDTDFVAAGLSLPLPLWDRQSGRRQAAAAAVTAAEARVQALGDQLAVAAAELHAEAEAAAAEAIAWREELVPAAAQVRELAGAGFRQGETPFGDLLEAGRAHARAQLSLLAARHRWHAAAVRLQSLLEPTPGERR